MLNTQVMILQLFWFVTKLILIEIWVNQESMVKLQGLSGSAQPNLSDCIMKTEA